MTGKINIGDIVKLKSGGPAMTVSKPMGDGYRCKWFKGASSESAVFLEDELIEFVAPVND